MPGQEPHNVIDGKGNRVNLDLSTLSIKACPGGVVQITDDQGNGIQIASGGAVTVLGSGSLPAAGVTSWDARTGAVVPASGDYVVAQVTGAAPLLSPALVGTPTAPTGASGDASTLIATDEFVDMFRSFFGVNLPGLKFVPNYVHITATGNNDIYTVPANKRALFFQAYTYNNSGVSANVFPAIKIGGVYYELATLIAVGNNVLGNPRPIDFYVAEAGETIALNSTQQPLNAYVPVLEFDNTSKLATSKVTAFGVGLNTVYTVPGGKTAMLVGSTSIPFVGGATMAYSNKSGAGRTITCYDVPNGSVADATTQYSPATAVANLASASPAGPLVLGDGDALIINVDAATADQIAWVSHVEI